MFSDFITQIVLSTYFTFGQQTSLVCGSPVLLVFFCGSDSGQMNTHQIKPPNN